MLFSAHISENILAKQGENCICILMNGFYNIYRYNIFMRRDYTKLDQQSADGSNPDIELNPRIDKQFLKVGPRGSKIANQAPFIAQNTSDKVKDMKSIYLQGMPSKNNEKYRSQKVDNKINADQLIKVLQNGRQRRNLRKRKNQNFDGIIEDSVQIKGSQVQLQKAGFSSEILTGGRTSDSHKFLQSPQRKRQDDLKIRKVLKQMKQQERKLNKLKQETEWKEIESLLTCKSEIESPINEKQRNKRRHQLQAAKQLLTGKVTIVWIFAINSEIQENDMLRIKKMYSGLSDTPYIVPFCNRAAQIKTFLEIPNSLFKIVADMDNFEQALKCRINNKVVQFYVYNNQGQKGIPRALAFKAESRKVKGIYNNLTKIIDRAEDEIQNQIQLYQTKKGITKKNNFKKFPSFIKLSGEDKTYATLYRANLYGAKNVPYEQLRQHYEQFMNLVKQKYGEIEHQKKHIADYTKLSHFQKQIGLTQARQVIKFYVRQSFYYQILNSMLRTMKTTQEFKPCIFPFYQNYHAVKKFYMMDLEKNNRKIIPQILYRGARLRTRDFNALKPGIFIEMLGFMSTSKSLQRAKQFCDRDGYIFVITVPPIVVPEKFNKYDHGFVDINKHQLASKQFSVQQEILFNALNVFKVTKIEKDGARHLIHMQYGPIFQLLSKNKSELTSDEKDVLINYQYCAHLLDQIEDQGDVYLLANQYDESKNYYEQKLKDNNQDGKLYYKLANVQQQCGELEEANKNVQMSLQIQLQNLDINDREKCLKVFSIHSKNAEISLDQQDYLTADDAITNAIQLLADDNEFQKAKKLRERGQIKFKKGEIIQAQKDFQLSQNIFKGLTNKAALKRKSINQSYYFSFLSLICSSTTQEDLDKEREERLKQIEKIEKQIKNMEDEINDELIRVNGSLKQVAHYAEDKEKYQICVKKARAYLLGVQSRQTNDPIQKAKLKALEATIQDYLELAESQKLLYEAIQLVQSSEPFNPNVGKYSQILGSLQKKQLQKFSNPKVLLGTRLQRGMQPIKYDQQEHNKIYNKCKKNFEKAINVLLYNNKTKSSPEVISLKNQLGELDFYQSKFQASQKIIKEAREASKDTGHSEISRSCLLLSKIGYARGQLKDSFENVQEAIKTLHSAIVKKQEPKYLAIFESNDILLQIKLHRSKIYLKQLQHDLSLRDLQSMTKAIEKKTDQKDNHSMLADILELRAENNLAKNGTFDGYFQKAIKLRQKQIGQYNLANAVTLCNYVKYLILVSELREAQKMLHKAVEIFSCFSEEHPITWLVLYCGGLLKQRKQENQQAVNYIRKSLHKVCQKYDKDHITVNKMRLQYGKALQKAGKIEDAIKQFESLQVDLEDEIRASQARKAITKERDDEKISVKRFLYQSLQQSYKEMNRIDVSNLNETTVAMNRCQKKMNQLKRSFNFDMIQKEQ